MAESPAGLSHLDERGRVRMVDVGGKPVSERRAVASARLRMRPETLRLMLDDRLPKGDVLATARIAGIMAAKKTAELIPMCHPLNLTHARVDIEPAGEDALRITAEVAIAGRTGVEMEALTAASVAALTIYDMCKAVDRGMVIENVRLEHKSGGKSGTYEREGAL